MSAIPPHPAAAADAAGGDSTFEASTFERSIAAGTPRRWMRWHLRGLALTALLGCLSVFTLAGWLAAAPAIDAQWVAGTDGTLVLQSSKQPALDALRGQVLTQVLAPGLPPLDVDAGLLHRWPRWQVDDARRAHEVAQHEGLAQRLAAAPGAVQLRFADGRVVDAPVAPRGYRGLGLPFWPLTGVALLLYLLAVVLVLARPQPHNLLFVTMALCQVGNLLFTALASGTALGLPAGASSSDLPLRVAFDLCTGAAALHLFALHPRRLPHVRALATAGWTVPLLWVALILARPDGAGLPLWWLAQGAGLLLGGAALAVAGQSHRLEPNPYALAMRRLTAAALLGSITVTALVGAASHAPALAHGVPAGVSLAWAVFLAGLLLLTPLLARSRQLLREFALLAGVSTVATLLDLLFVAVFSLGTFTSLAIAMFIALGLYAGARQWLLNHLIGSRVLTTERIFDQLYRAAREVQARPARYPQLLTQLLRDLFDPLEVLRVDRVPVRSRVVSGGAALVVPMRTAGDETASTGPSAVGLVLRFAQRGQRLFTVDDARLADRVVDQLRRAVAYDRAVERGRFEERQRIAQDLHDDIGARLLTLMYQAQNREMEDYIRHTLQDLKTLTRGLAASEHRLSHAAAEWKSDLTQRLTAAHVALGWSFSTDRDLRLSVVQWSALTRVLRELVSNALYHGHASRIDVAFSLEGPLLTLQVADDGNGRNPQAWAHGLGLGGVRKRVKVLGGEVAWSENGELGIVCAVRVPDFHGRS